MVDVVDLAQDAVLAAQEQLLSRARRKAAAAGRADCRDCGEVIEPAWLAAHPSAQACAFCQTQIEERLRR